VRLPIARSGDSNVPEGRVLWDHGQHDKGLAARFVDGSGWERPLAVGHYGDGAAWRLGRACTDAVAG